MSIKRLLLGLGILGIAALLVVLAMSAPFIPTARATTAASAQRITRSPITPTYTSAITPTYEFNNDGRVFLDIVSTYTGTVLVTIETPYTIEGFAVADLTFTMPAGAHEMVGPFPPLLFNDANDACSVTFTDATSVTVAALRF